MRQPQAGVQAQVQPQPHCYAQVQPSFPSSSHQSTPMQIALPQPQSQATTTFPAQPQPQPQPPPSTTSTSFRQPEHLMYKNRLQEFTHKSNIPLPVYDTVNEASPHAPMFRATVLVDGVKYTSPNTFSTRKAAEQDVAELALKFVSQKNPDEGVSQGFPEAVPLINEDTIFCKSILNEFATKMNIGLPTYNTIKSEGLLPVFISSLVFNGVSYTGNAGKNKKEAEQLAARAVILSLLGDSKVKNVLHDIIKSKVKLYAAFHKVNNLSTVPPTTITSHGSTLVPGKDIGGETDLPATNALTTVDSLPKSVDNASTGLPAINALTSVDSLPKPVDNASTGAIHGCYSGNGSSKHEFIAQKPENSSGALNLPEAASQASNLPIAQASNLPIAQASNLPIAQASNLPIEFVHPTSAPSMETGPSSKKRRRNKKKANKRLCTSTQGLIFPQTFASGAEFRGS